MFHNVYKAAMFTESAGNFLLGGPLRFLRWAVCSFVLALAAMPVYAQYTFNDLYDFNCATGCQPFNYGTLAFGRDYRLYGTTWHGGANNQGELFAATTTGAYTPLFDFGGSNGGDPVGGLTAFNDPVTMHDFFYGTTTMGGKYGFGVVFRYDATASTFTVLHSFNGADGQNPQTPPVIGSNGNLYGVTGTGTIYRITRPKDTVTVLTGKNAGGSTTAPLYLASDHNLWGVTNNGGTFGYGSVFYMTTAGNVTTVYNFTAGMDGSNPGGPLTEDVSGTLYGTAAGSGANGNGVIFTTGIKKPWPFNPLYPFDAGFHNSDGSNPAAGLTPAGGNLYLGANAGGGTYGYGTLFAITSTAKFTDLFELDEPGPPWAVPETTLRQFMDGNFYGLMSSGIGTPGAGTLYSLNPPNPHVNITWCCNINLILDQPVTVLGIGLEGAVNVTFGGAQAQFQQGSNSYLTAYVPNGAVDGPLAVVLPTGEQVESLQIAHILPKIVNLDPSSGPVGTTVDIVGGGFAGTTRVTFGGVKAPNFTVLSASLIQVIVPTGAKTGKVDVTTSNGTAVSPEVFTVN